MVFSNSDLFAASSVKTFLDVKGGTLTGGSSPVPKTIMLTFR